MKFILIYLNSPHPHRKSSILDKSHLCQSFHNIVTRHFSWVLSLTWVDSTVIKWLFHNIRVVNLNKAVIIISAHIREKCIARENVTHIHTRFTLRTCRKKRILLAGCRRTWACVFFVSFSSLHRNAKLCLVLNDLVKVFQVHNLASHCANLK